jgi:hypothetical protein
VAFGARGAASHMTIIPFLRRWAAGTALLQCYLTSGYALLMRFLEVSELRTWCAEHVIELESGSLRPVPDPSFKHRNRVQYATGRRSEREAAFAAACIEPLGEWDECLLLVTLWGVWPSGEDWPRYYAARGHRNMRLSLNAAPGHWFGPGEKTDLLEFFTMVLEFAWDAYVLPMRAGSSTGMRVQISHDEWLELQSLAKIEFKVPST